MSMHLERPGLTMSGKKKGKQKFASAEAKRHATELAKSWQDLKTKEYAAKPAAPVRKTFKAVSVSPEMSTPRVAVAAVKLPSRVTAGGECTKKEPTIYTGSKIIGIATMHKSNLVPIFSDEEAKAVSSMRR